MKLIGYARGCLKAWHDAIGEVTALSETRGSGEGQYVDNSPSETRVETSNALRGVDRSNESESYIQRLACSYSEVSPIICMISRAPMIM